jgi:hypothetical protein
MPRLSKSGARYANGRKAVISTIDYILSRRQNLVRLHDDLQEAFEINPAQFVKDFALPLTPKEMLEDAEDGDTIQSRAERIREAAVEMGLTVPDEGTSSVGAKDGSEGTGNDADGNHTPLEGDDNG